jgi:peptide/nickel transport system permease protein
MAIAVEIDALQEPRASSGGVMRGISRAARKNPVGAFAGVVCILLIILAIVGPQITPYPADKTGFARLESPNWSHPFGTDNLFRDMFSRIIVGARNSLGISFASVFVGTAIGVSLGVSSGYLAGKWDMFVSRIIDVKQSYPPLVFIIFFLSVFQPSYFTICAAIGLILVPGTTRVVRGATIGIRNLQYIEAAISLGNGPLRIMWRHVLPNVAAPIIVIASVQIGGAILAEATISFLGLGISSAVNPSWGRMLQETRPVWQAAWWTAIVPGVAISITVLAFNIFGDALRDALDPRLRGSR